MGPKPSECLELRTSTEVFQGRQKHAHRRKCASVQRPHIVFVNQNHDDCAHHHQRDQLSAHARQRRAVKDGAKVAGTSDTLDAVHILATRVAVD